MRKEPVNKPKDYSFVSPSHVRSGRAWLGWNLDVIAEKSGLARDTISRFERGAQKIANSTRGLLYEALYDAGVELVPDGIRARQ